MKFIKLFAITTLISALLLFPVNASETDANAATEPTISVIETTVPIAETSVPAAEADPVTPVEQPASADVATISLILTSVTAIAAIVVPAISTMYTNYNNRKLKEIDIRFPRTYDAFDALFDTYDHLSRIGGNTEAYPDVNPYWISENFQKFIIAFHKLLPMIPDTSLHDRALALIKDIAAANGHVSQETDKVFFGIIADMSRSISPRESIFRRLWNRFRSLFTRNNSSCT